VSSKVRLRDAYSIPTVSYVHHFPVSAGVWSRPDTRGAITSATTRYERMSDKVNLRGSACTIAGTPGRKQDMVRHLRITNFRYVYCSLPHSCSRAHTRGTKTLFLRELLGLRWYSQHFWDPTESRWRHVGACRPARAHGHSSPVDRRHRLAAGQIVRPYIALALVGRLLNRPTLPIANIAQHTLFSMSRESLQE